MIALNILEIKDFMNKLLCTDTFDHFLVKEATIKSNVIWHMDGTLSPDFYSEDELTQLGLTDMDFLPFSQARSHCFDLIKGKRTPSYFKFIFLLSPTNLTRTLAQIDSSYTASDISAMFLNLTYQHGKLLLTTGISYRIFSTDKGLAHEWDNLIKKFLKSHAILFEEL